jgi:trimethylamine:corrinoid methyltransferase-like protein
MLEMKVNYVNFKSPQFRVLSKRQISELHFASTHILERTGVAIYSDEALALLGDAGADCRRGHIKSQAG